MRTWAYTCVSRDTQTQSETRAGGYHARREKGARESRYAGKGASEEGRPQARKLEHGGKERGSSGGLFGKSEIGNTQGGDRKRSSIMTVAVTELVVFVIEFLISRMGWIAYDMLDSYQ